MNAPRIKLPRRPEAAPDLARYITVDDVMRVERARRRVLTVCETLRFRREQRGY